jgi:hypothetical protein
MVTTGMHRQGETSHNTPKRKTGTIPAEPGLRWSPDVFEFYYGRFSGNSCYARLDGEKVLFEQTCGGNFSSGTREITPSEDEWRVFFETISVIGCAKWHPEYISPHGCCGATYWHISIKYQDYLVSSRGEDAFPGTPGQSPSGEFKAFLAAFHRFIAAGPGAET